MLSWVVKVVPKPPEPPSRKVNDTEEGPAQAPPAVAAPPPVQEKKVTFQDDCKAEAPKGDKPKAASSPAIGSQPGMLAWISGALPQPAVSPSARQADGTQVRTSAVTLKTKGPVVHRGGMMSWISQSLDKIVPQPAGQQAEPQPQVLAPAAGSAQLLPVKAESDPEDRSDSRPLPPSVMGWIKQGFGKMVPQPDALVLPKVQKPADPVKAAAPATAELPAAVPAQTEPSSGEAAGQPNVVTWIVSGLGRMLPQPAAKQDGVGGQQQIGVSRPSP
ncbi:unnamed protein product [Tetraodon nigroviridis]|uniref:(spotted green pufferfish) hypothetical protein n=1 Tax=Tetraodon nigroviridis TaxID=99883 RepID=Q4T4Q4_TETNG|nr:unnamed protein product [Tetraodon nigroviridis]